MTQKLPESTVLAAHRQNRETYWTIADMYGVSHQAVWDKLNRCGLRDEVYHAPNANAPEFQVVAGTVVALIRAGYRNQRDIQRAMGHKHTSKTNRLINRLVKQGLVKKPFKRQAVLTLTEHGRAFAPLVIMARRRPDGGLEKLTTGKA